MLGIYSMMFISYSSRPWVLERIKFCMCATHPHTPHAPVLSAT
jgi:hypothetical protein